MPNLLLVGKTIPPSISMNIVKDCMWMMRKLGYGDEDAVITTCAEDRTDDGEQILLYGFECDDPCAHNSIPYRIMKECEIATRIVPSNCNTVGDQAQASPHIVLITTPGKSGTLATKLKNMHLGYDVEVHLVGSNVSAKASQDFYVRIKLLESEAEEIVFIINGLKKLGLTRQQIWVSIINDFLPADKMI